MTNEGGSNVRRLSKPSPLQVGLQVPCRIRAQTTAEGDLREHPPATGAGFPRFGKAEGMPDRGGTPDARPRAYVHRDSAEAPSGFGNWLLASKIQPWLWHTATPAHSLTSENPLQRPAFSFSWVGAKPIVV